jgi:hypothetical protein
MKTDISKNDDLFRTHKSISPEEVFAAGGPTAYGIKMGKNNETMIKALQNAPPIEPFTDEEWADVLLYLEKDK